MRDAASSPCRVVLCDDAVGYVRIVKLLIQSADLAVVGEAVNGEEAVAVCRELQPDILLLDISMPIMDGLTALPLVLDASPDTKVIMHSGFGTDAVRERARELGAVDFIEKGIEPLALPDRILAHR